MPATEPDVKLTPCLCVCLDTRTVLTGGLEKESLACKATEMAVPATKMMGMRGKTIWVYPLAFLYFPTDGFTTIASSINRSLLDALFL